MSDEQENSAPAGFIPIERFKQINQARKAAEARVAELETIASASEGYRSEIETLRADLGSARSSRDMTEALVEAGVYGRDERKLARYCYEQLDAESRPAFGDYLSSQKETPSGLMKNVWTPAEIARATPASPSASISNGAPDVNRSQEPQKAPERSSAPAVDVNRGVAPPRPPQGSITADYIKNIDSDTYKQQRDEIRRQYFNSRRR